MCRSGEEMKCAVFLRGLRYCEGSAWSYRFPPHWAINQHLYRGSLFLRTGWSIQWPAICGHFCTLPEAIGNRRETIFFLEQNVCIGHYLLLILDPSALRKTQVFTCKRKKLRSGKNPVKEVVVYAGLGKILGWWRALTFIIPNVMQDSGASLSLFPWTHIPGLSGWVSDCQNPTLG